ncbi:uncharacterized protein LOC101882843 precursor [Danio rerio]|uniref:Uncharacterized protein LOC101882843 precursor n=1 Tax=Danio rerio TaxID=7955 RepID=A0AB13A944_DANRE|nr:uncharacterized protein LOC101882843 precursor [Danio rerio]|eukprot:XP_005174067.1 uncharacterized protein LOC101882843 [Danio rerio]
MRTVLLLLVYLLLWCQTTGSLTDKRVNLGENVTLDCQIGVKEMYWVFQKLIDSPVLILRTYSSESTAPRLLEERFRGKYSSLTYSRLFISNITIDELGIYYCLNRNNTGIQLSSGIRLNITESTKDHNQNECNKHQPQVDKSLETQKILTAASFLLNTVLIIAIIGLLMSKLKKPTKSRQQCQNVPLEPLEDLNAQYSEIELPTHVSTESPHQVNGTYVLLQKPRPQTR